MQYFRINDKVTIEVVSTLDEFYRLRPIWELLLANRAHTVFDTFKWNYAWLHSHKTIPRFYVYIVKHDGRVRSIAPFVYIDKNIWLMGGKDADFHNPPVALEDWKHIISLLKGRVYLSRLPYSCRFFLEGMFCVQGMEYLTIAEKEYALPVNKINESFEDLVLDESVRRELLYKLRKAKRRGEVEFREIKDREEFESYLDFVEKHYKKRAEEKDYRSIFSNSHFRTFLSKLFNENPRLLRAFTLSLDSRVMAIELGFYYKGVYHSHLTCFDKDFFRYSPGLMRIPFLGLYAKEHKFNFVSLGAGEQKYKQYFSNIFQRYVSVIIFKNKIEHTLYLFRGKFRESRRLKIRTRLKHLFFRLLIIFKIHLIFEHRNEKRLRIVCYHKVTDFEVSYLAVLSSTFRDQLKYIMKNFQILRLSEVADYLSAEKKLPRRAISITFDDGYLNNYEVVFPIIKSLGIPISIFITGKCMKEGAYHSWDKAHEKLLTFDQITEMMDSGLVDFYPHTMSHSILANLANDDARKEIEESKRIVEEIVGAGKAHVFAYPSGGKDDFTKETERLVKGAGFTMAVSIGSYSEQKNINMMSVERKVMIEEPLFIAKLRMAGVIDFMKRIFPY